MMKVEIVFTAVLITLMVAYSVKSAPLTEEDNSGRTSIRSTEEENGERLDPVVQNAPSENESDFDKLQLKTITSESEGVTSDVTVEPLGKDSIRELRKAEYDGGSINAENVENDNVALRALESNENVGNANEALNNAEVEVEAQSAVDVGKIIFRSPEKESDKGIKRTQNVDESKSVENDGVDEKTAFESEDVDVRSPEKESDKGLKNAENNENSKRSTVDMVEKPSSKEVGMTERQTEKEIYNAEIEDSKVNTDDIVEKSADEVDVVDSLEEAETRSEDFENVNSNLDNSETVGTREKSAGEEQSTEPLPLQESDNSLKTAGTVDSELSKSQDVQVNEQSVSEKAGGGQTLERESDESLKTATDVAVDQETSDRTVSVDEKISERTVSEVNQSANGRSMQPKIIDTKVRSGFEAQVDDDGNVKFTEDDVSADVRSAFPLDRRIVSVMRNINIPIPPLIRSPLISSPLRQPSVFPIPQPPVFPDQQFPVYQDQQYPFLQDFLSPFRSYQELQTNNQFQVKTPPLSYSSSHETKTVQNSYPYQPLTTLPPPQTLPNLSPDNIFNKLTQATNAARSVGTKFNLSPPLNTYGFPNYLSQLI